MRQQRFVAGQRGVHRLEPCAELLALLMWGRIARHRQQSAHQGDDGVIGDLLPIREGLRLQQAPPCQDISGFKGQARLANASLPKETYHLPLPVARLGPQRV